MYCLKCRVDAKPDYAEFCPECGAAASTLKQCSGVTVQRDGTAKRDKTFQKKNVRIMAVAMAAMLSVTGVSTACSRGENAEPENTVAQQPGEDEPGLQSQEDGAGMQSQEDRPDLESQEDDPLSSITNNLNAGYEDEKKSIDLLVEAYWVQYDPYSEFHLDLSSALGTTEMLYDKLNSMDPYLKDVAALSAGFEHEGTIMEKYLVGKGVGIFLGDNETGRVLRSNAEIVSLALLEGFINILSDETVKSQTYARADALQPIAIGENYTLVRSLGDIGELLEQIEDNSGYTYYTQPLKARRDAVWSAIKSGTMDEADIEICTGRINALDEAIDEAEAELIPLKKAFLTSMGFSEEGINGEFGSSEAMDADASEEMVADMILLREMFRDYMDFTEDELAAYEAEAAELAGMAFELNDEYVMFFDYFAELHPEYAESLESFSEEVERRYDEFPSQQTQETDEQIPETVQQKPDMSWYVYCIIDRSGQVYGSFLSPYGDLSAIINEDGSCTITQNADGGLENASYHIIVSREGKILYESDAQNSVKENRQIYYDLSPSGTTLRKTYSSDFENGEREAVEFIRADGSAEEILSGKEVHLSHAVDWFGVQYNDYYEYECVATVAGMEWDRGYIDMYTGQLITADEFGRRTARDDSAPQPVIGDALNDRYAISGSTIYDYEGTAVKELTAGNGVKEIRYSDGRYMVLTVSGWYYVLDEQLEYASDPVETIVKEYDPMDDSGYSVLPYQLTPYGLFVGAFEEDGSENPDDGGNSEVSLNYYLYDREGQKLLLHTARNQGLVDYYDAIGWDESYVYIIGNKYAGWINLETMEPMLLDVDGVARTLVAQ